MATYCVSDVHGEYAAFLHLLETIRFSADDTLYIIGDLVDRGPQPLTLVRDVMARDNVVALAGNHDLLACIYLRKLTYGGRAEDLDEQTMMNILVWRGDGGAATLAEFHRLSIPEREEIVDWLEELELYAELTIGGETYVLVHAGLGEKADPDRPLEDYELEDYLFTRPDYDRVIFPDKYIVSGHTPTRLIAGNGGADRIVRVNRHIAIDCGCTFGGRLAALCLETGEEFYVDKGGTADE